MRGLMMFEFVLFFEQVVVVFEGQSAMFTSHLHGRFLHVFVAIQVDFIDESVSKRLGSFSFAVNDC